MSRETKGGLVLLCAAVCAFVLANSPLANVYQALGHFSKPSLVFIVNECLMTLFFFVVGLEIRREMRDGELNSFAKSSLPAVAAFGGMVIPALFYFLIARGDTTALRGFGIPVATDIAFALSLLSVFGSRVPLSLKAFLTALAIFDDIGAIIIIAVFYTHQLSVLWLILSVAAALAMFALRKTHVESLFPYAILGGALWLCTLQSGVHATIAGVIIAFLVPVQVLRFKHSLESWTTFAVLPLFAFLNAGITLDAMVMQDILAPVTLGILCGLFIGKPIGVFAFTWILVKAKLAPKPQGATWPQIFGIATVCGIGFTMSLFVGMLAFEEQAAIYQVWTRSGVLAGSLLSAFAGALILAFTLRRHQKDAS